MSKLSPQQQRKYQRLSEKTGRDYSVRNPTFRLNMNMRDIARFAGLDKQGWYSRVPSSIRNAQINKQFYGNPMKKGWHSSQRTGRGQGVRQLPRQLGGQDAATQRFLRGRFDIQPVRGVPGGIVRDVGESPEAQYAARREAMTKEQRQLADRIARGSHPEFVHSRREAAGLPSLRLGPKPPSRTSHRRMGPQQDWLSQLYSSHNINQGKLDQGARDYWSNEAKTKGRDAVMQSIIGTSKAQGTYGGRKKPQRITTGSRRRGGGGPIGAAISAGIGLLGSSFKAKQAKQHHRQQAAARQKSYDLQAKGMKRRQGMIAKTIAATMAARGI